MTNTRRSIHRGFTIDVVDYTGDSAVFAFNTDIGGGGFGSDNLPGFGVRTRNDDGQVGPVVRVGGEDLTALRDAILSLPDEAFPVPPEPPYVSLNGWVKDDIVHYPGGATYVRDDEGFWFSSWTEHYGTDPATDKDIDSMLDINRHSGDHVALRRAGRFV